MHGAVEALTLLTISHFMESFVHQFLFSFGNTWVRCIYKKFLFTFKFLLSFLYLEYLS